MLLGPSPAYEGDEQSTSRLPIAGVIPESSGGRPEQSSLLSTHLPRGSGLDGRTVTCRSR